jgi:hypothetical protein
MLTACMLGAGLLLAGASTAQQARTSVVPYLEVQQVLTADLNGGGDDDVLTYTALAAGIDATVSTARVQAQASYRYERRIAWNGDLDDQDVHSGIAQARVQLVPGNLVFDTGALAARARSDGGGPIFGVTSIDDPNVAEVYGVYAGPSLTADVGPVKVAASYRLAYVHIDDQGLAGVPLQPGAVLLDRYDSSTTHSAELSVGMAPGELPFGWTVGGGYVREDVGRLDQAFEGKFIRGDIVFPVSPTLALTAGAGYEEIQSSQQDVRRGSNGVPIVTPGGNFIPDPDAPRLLSYDESGLIWDAGVIYRPSRRTELQARVGERYGGTSVTGSLRHQFNSAYGVTATVYDSVDSFGRLVVSDLRGVPTGFDPRRNPLNNNLGGVGGCLYGEPGSGVCFDDALQSISTGNFRNRGLNVLFSGGRGPWSFNLGGGYSNRRYFAPSVAGNAFAIDRVTEESFTLQGGATRELSRTASVSVDAFASWYDTELPLGDGSFGTGITGSYTQRFLLDRLQGQAALGLYHTDSGDFDSSFLSALIGLRYSF